MSHERAEETNPSAGYIVWLLSGGRAEPLWAEPGAGC